MTDNAQPCGRGHGLVHRCADRRRRDHHRRSRRRCRGKLESNRQLGHTVGSDPCATADRRRPGFATGACQRRQRSKSNAQSLTSWLKGISPSEETDLPSDGESDGSQDTAAVDDDGTATENSETTGLSGAVAVVISTNTALATVAPFAVINAGANVSVASTVIDAMLASAAGVVSGATNPAASFQHSSSQFQQLLQPANTKNNAVARRLAVRRFHQRLASERRPPRHHRCRGQHCGRCHDHGPVRAEHL